ncbi:hypothetical protein GWI33_011750, partial [Rhynchophorus ferrugineus]
MEAVGSRLSSCQNKCHSRDDAMPCGTVEKRRKKEDLPKWALKVISLLQAREKTENKCRSVAM